MWGLADTYSEKDLETAILREIQSFLMELGVGFTFVARQQRIVIGGKDHQIDLLFYHRKLRQLVAIELKIGPFEAAHKGQLELYLSWLNKHEREPGEESPIGIILCTEANLEEIELLQIGKDDIHIAEYITEKMYGEQMHLPGSVLFFAQPNRDSPRSHLECSRPLLDHVCICVG